MTALHCKVHGAYSDVCPDCLHLDYERRNYRYLTLLMVLIALLLVFAGVIGGFYWAQWVYETGG